MKEHAEPTKNVQQQSSEVTLREFYQTFSQLILFVPDSIFRGLDSLLNYSRTVTEAYFVKL